MYLAGDADLAVRQGHLFDWSWQRHA
jgi:hypothetical protein